MVTLILELAGNKQSVVTHDHTYMSLACFYYYTLVCIYGHKIINDSCDVKQKLQ